ncbi:MAG: agmatinase [Bacteroidota bacterium]
MGDELFGLPWQQRTPFLASNGEYETARAVILGAPMDWSVSYRPGSRFGPASIREVSEAIEEYSPYRDKSLFDLAFYDAGDLVLPFGNTAGALDLIETAVRGLLAAGKFPLLLGGEHLVSYPAIRAAHRHYPDLCVFQFDAHTDLRPGYLGQQLSHASVMRLAQNLLGDGRVFQFGIRSGDREEFAFARDHTHLYRGGVLDAVQAAIREIGSRPVYVTVDIDVVDPAHAPGTGTPECGGITSAELLRVFDYLPSLQVVGFDLVEVLPAVDLSARTALLAAVLVREALLGLVCVQGDRTIQEEFK